jgi:hypothetical protein
MNIAFIRSEEAYLPGDGIPQTLKIMVPKHKSDCYCKFLQDSL